MSQIKKIVRDYDEEEMEKIFWREHRERQKWIEPVEIVWEKQLEEWLAKDFEGKEFQE